MELAGRVIVVTGGTGGIGEAMCRRLAAEEPKALVVSDLPSQRGTELAAELNGRFIACDVSNAEQIQRLVDETVAAFGPIDLFCSNAGITVKGGIDTPVEDWQRMWDVNLMSQVHAARAVLPGMLERGEGYLLQTSSAAGLLTEIGSAAYSVTKHAVIAFAEWLSVHYRRSGIRVSCLCPAGVQTEFLDLDDPVHQFLHVHSVTPEQVAESVVEGLREETFLILPHPEVAEFFAFKGEDYNRWLNQFSRIQQKIERKRQRSADK